MMGKSLEKNALFNVVYKCLNVIFPLVTVSYVSRVLGPEGIGKVSAAQNIVQYFVIIAALGLPTYGVKKIAECRDVKKQLSRVFTELFVVNLISTFLCSILYLILIIKAPYYADKIVLYLVVGIQLFSNVINIDWFYQGLEEYRYIMIRSLFVKAIGLACVFVFIRQKEDFILYAAINALSLVGNYVWNVLKLKHFTFLSFEHLDIKQHLRPIFILLAASIAIEIYTLLATTMLNFMKNDAIVGYYTNATKMVSVVRMLIASVCAVFLPRLNYYYYNGRVDDFSQIAIGGLRLIMQMAIPASFLLIILSQEVVLVLFGQSFVPSIMTMQILSLSIITVALSNFTGYQVLVTVGKEKTVLVSTIIGALVNVALNYFLILYYSHYGAAVASVITEIIIAIYQFYYVNKILRFSVKKDFIISFVVPLVCMVIIAIALKLVVSSAPIIRLILIGSISIIVYSLIGYRMNNELIMRMLKFLKITK